MLDDEIHTLDYFHKDSVTGCKEIQKGCDIKEEIEKYCGDWKVLWWLKKIVMIEKDCDDWKRLW